MTRKQILLRYLWLAPITFGLITLVSYKNDVDDISYGFPERFFSKNYGMDIITREMRTSTSFHTDEFLRDIGFAMMVAAVLMILYTLFKRKKRNKSGQ